MRHAWLIIAHNEFEVLQHLVSMLDVFENDFYIHFDKKVATIPEIQVSNGSLTVLKERIDVRWGTVSQIRAELALFEAAYSKRPYVFYHIISGTTLPLMPAEEINKYFETVVDRCVIAGMIRDSAYQETLKMRRCNLFLANFNSPHKNLRKLSQFLWRVSIAIQRMLDIRINSDKMFYKASNWLSISEKAVELILSRKNEILRTYRWSFCGDEYFIPSELMDSELRDKVLNCEKYLLQTIGRANAEVFHLAEWQDLRSSGYMFARKFVQ